MPPALPTSASVEADGSFDLWSAKGGTQLMQSVQTIGIDLPLKVLVWRDDAGQTFFPITIRRMSRIGMVSAMPSSPSSRRCRPH